MIPGTVPADRLVRARRLARLTVYGTAPVAGLLFSALALLSRAFRLEDNLALYVNAGIFVVSAAFAFTLHSVPRENISVPSFIGQILAGRSTADPGLIAGVVGTVSALGVVIGVGRMYVGRFFSRLS